MIDLTRRGDAHPRVVGALAADPPESALVYATSLATRRAGWTGDRLHTGALRTSDQSRLTR
jgi:hypothetical protein